MPLADYLVRKGVPFRDAHAIVGQAVALAIEQGIALADVSIEAFKELSPAIEPDVYHVLTLDGSVAARNHIGGTAPEAVRSALAEARRRTTTPAA